MALTPVRKTVFLMQAPETTLVPVANPRGNRLLAGLSPRDLDSFVQGCEFVHFQPGEILHEPGDTLRHVWFPESGLISLVHVVPEGDAIEIALVGREGAIGAGAGLGCAVAPSRAVVRIRGRARRVEATRLAAAAAQNEAVRTMLIRYTNALSVEIQHTAVCHALHGLEARLCRLLLTAFARAETEAIPFTQEQLADMLGVRRSTVTMAAKMLLDAGVIYYRRGLIRIRDRARLQQAACRCAGFAVDGTSPPIAADVLPAEIAVEPFDRSFVDRIG